MKVLVDTCVWSQLLRKATDENDPIVLELNELIKEYRVQMIGPIRQELLSGIKNKNYNNTKKIIFIKKNILNFI